jgi:hypothetical protein
MPRFMISRLSRLPVLSALSLLSLFAASTALANSTGLPGRARVGCAEARCHMGGTEPTLAFETPSGLVAPGATVNLMLTALGPQAGGQSKAGLNVEAGAGTLIPDADGVTRSLLGQLVHSAPVPFEGDRAMFMFQWTAPDTAGPVTIYAAVNSVNGDFNTTGDNSAVIEATIEVGDAAGGAGGEPGTGGDPGSAGGLIGVGGESGTGGTPDTDADGGVDGTGDSGGDSGGCQTQPGKAPLSGLGAAFAGLGLLTFRRRLRRR